MLGILLPLAAAGIVAQTAHELVADVPFEFSVCAEQLPAGTYKVRMLSGSNPHVMLVSSDNRRSVIMACGHPIQLQKQNTTAKLIFNQYGNKYFLSELWLGEITGTELFKAEQEQALLREVKERKQREKVTIKVTETKP
jgi:hypothetical protein